MFRSTIAVVGSALLLIYVAGVAVGLAKVDAPPPARLAVAAVWPLGLLAMAITVPILIIAALVLFPLVGAAVLAMVVGWAVFLH